MKPSAISGLMKIATPIHFFSSRPKKVFKSIFQDLTFASTPPSFLQTCYTDFPSSHCLNHLRWPTFQVQFPGCCQFCCYCLEDCASVIPNVTACFKLLKYEESMVYKEHWREVAHWHSSTAMALQYFSFGIYLLHPKLQMLLCPISCWPFLGLIVYTSECSVPRAIFTTQLMLPSSTTQRLQLGFPLCGSWGHSGITQTLPVLLGDTLTLCNILRIKWPLCTT